MNYKVGDAVEWALEAGVESEILFITGGDSYSIKTPSGVYVAQEDDLCLWSDTLFGYPFKQGAADVFKKNTGLSWSKFVIGESVSIEGRQAKVIAVDERWNVSSDFKSTYYLVEYDAGGRAELPERDLSPLKTAGCECGAKYTTFANMHMHYCPLAGAK